MSDKYITEEQAAKLIEKSFENLSIEVELPDDIGGDSGNIEDLESLFVKKTGDNLTGNINIKNETSDTSLPYKKSSITLYESLSGSYNVIDDFLYGREVSKTKLQIPLFHTKNHLLHCMNQIVIHT